MSFTLLALGACGALLASGGVYWWRRCRSRLRAAAAGDAALGAAASAAPGAPKGRERDAQREFSVNLGDVVTVDGQEMWLNEGWLLHEAGEPVAALLFSKEGALLALPPPRSGLWLLHRESVQLVGEPPVSLCLRDRTYERVSRLPVQVEMLGRTVEPPCRSAILGEGDSSQAA